MKNFMPLAAMQTATGNEMTTAGVVKNGRRGAEKAVSGGFLAAMSGSQGSLPEPLAGLLSPGAATLGSTGQALSSGKTLPPAVSAATSGLVVPLSEAIDEGVQHDPAFAAGLPVNTLASPQDADASSTATIEQLSKLIARTPPQRAVAGGDTAAQALDRSAVITQAGMAQSEQAPSKPEALLSAEASITRMQQGRSETLFTQDDLNRDTSVKAGLTQPLNKTIGTEIQPNAIKVEAFVNETDRLFNSRIQLFAMNQTSELAAHKPAPDVLPGAPEALQAGLARGAVSQPGLSGDLLSASAQTVIAETFGKPEWGQGMGKQILWMVNQSISRAEIRLNPANLGPLEVRIEMDNDQVNVAFTSRHADVREAVEQALPRLREMLEDKGLNLADTDVSNHDFAEQQQRFGGPDGHSSGLSSVGEDVQNGDTSQLGIPTSPAISSAGEGLVDYYI